MKVDELTAQDKDMDFKPLNIKKEVQDQVMEHWGFKDPGQMFEAGVLLLQTFTEAAKEGCKMAYFEKEVDGKKAYLIFNYLGLIEYIKDPNRPPGSTHEVKKVNYENKGQ